MTPNDEMEQIATHLVDKWHRDMIQAYSHATMEEPREKTIRTLPGLDDLIERVTAALRQRRGADTDECKLGEPLMHGPQPYRWCQTHNRLMIACEQTAPTDPYTRGVGDGKHCSRPGNAFCEQYGCFCPAHPEFVRGMTAGLEMAAKVVNDARFEGGADLRELVARIRALVPAPTPEEKDNEVQK